MRKYYIYILIAILIILTGCTNFEQNNRAGDGDFLGLKKNNTEVPEVIDQDHDNARNLNDPTDSIKTRESDEDPERDSAGELENRDENFKEEKNLEDEADVSATALTPYFDEDFQEKWNAIADEQNFDLYIRSFQMESNNRKTYYRADFKENWQLRVFTQDDRRDDNQTTAKINSMQFQGSAKGSKVLFTLFTGWSQVILISQPDFTMYDVDMIFNELGIEGNTKLTGKDQETVRYEGIEFRLFKKGNNFIFEAKYP